MKLFKGERVYNCDMNIQDERITTLEGSPVFVVGDFDCSYCPNLTSLKGAPIKCKKFNCIGCPKLKNLDPLLKCDIEEVMADKHLLDDFKKKKAIIEKYGFDNVMEVIEIAGTIL